MGTNLLRNGDFEAAGGHTHDCVIYYTNGTVEETQRGEINSPQHWTTWFRHGLPVEHDPGNSVGWAQPEVRDALAHNPDRMRSGEKGLLLFTFFKIHDGGLFQRVAVAPGTHLHLSAYAHAWSNHQDPHLPDVFPHPDDPHWSEGVGYGDAFILEGDTDDDAERNFTFWIGIDPTGGTDPFAETVIWGQGAHIYNGFHELPPVEATAQGNTVTVFLRSRTLWPFKHNDAYWDDIVLEASETEGGNQVPTEWAYPVISHGTKLGIHGIYSDNIVAHATTMVNNGTKLAIVKAVDDMGYIAMVKSASPATITVARFVSGLEGCQGVNDPHADLDDMADGLMAIILNKIAAQPELRQAVDYWEVVNEPDPPSAEGYARLARLMIKCMERAEATGLKIAIFSLNAGTPEWDEMVAMVETGVFGRAKEGGHILALHEGVTWQDKPIDYMWGDTIPGAPHVEGAGALHFRYRYLYHLLKQRNEVIPLFISEWYSGTYSQHGETGQQTAAKFQWCDEKYRQDYYVLGFCPFTLGPSPQWVGQNYGYAYAAAIQYGISIKEEPNALPPATVHAEIAFDPAEPETGQKVKVTVTADQALADVGLEITGPSGEAVTGTVTPSAGNTWRWTFTPTSHGNYHVLFTAAGGELHPASADLTVRPKPEQEPWGLPREQYARTYVLLPPTAGREWVQAILESGAWEERGWTIGRSADDAGIGALEDKMVLAVNPTEWGDDLQAFFQRYYPHVRYVPLSAATPAALRQALKDM